MAPQDTKEVKRWRKGVNPDLVAEVLFKLFGQSAQIVEHDDEDDLTKSAIDKLEVTRTVMDSLKVCLVHSHYLLSIECLGFQTFFPLALTGTVGISEERN